jgi:hypothetical protein
MTTTKRSHSFRISKQAEQHLNKIVNVTGMSKTAVVEMALAQLSQTIKGAEMKKNFSDRDYLDARMEKMNLGNDYSDTYDMSDEAFEALVKELETAAAKGLLNLETSEGVDQLAEIYNRHVYPD